MHARHEAPPERSNILECLSQVELHHHGIYQFKGLSEPAAVVQIVHRKWASRNFTARQSSKKAKVVGPGQGLLAIVKLPQQNLDHIMSSG